MAREVRLWEWLRDGLRGVEGLHMRRVENLVSEGDPDVDGCWKGRYFELELKGCDRPARDGRLDFDVRQSQVVWHRRRWKCGGNVWLYVRVGKGRDVRRYLVPGSKTALVKEGVTEETLASMSVLPSDHRPADLLARAVDSTPYR
ncbi:hypothetical protein AAT1_02042 [Pseudomonas phage AAT-1]|uniref:Uncharacterized protein n=1 Tax=Pseudomonas phage AAT-1 TaxID=1775248 RepID=A0A125SA72_9CAUD|nr:hypothetical protein P9A56_gp42 [Pseudomonas phage AAT-1]AME18068.1 hypothetical protein AAT1_02042 [Pseudomonas phage AAT-1]